MTEVILKKVGIHITLHKKLIIYEKNVFLDFNLYDICIDIFLWQSKRQHS